MDLPQRVNFARELAAKLEAMPLNMKERLELTLLSFFGTKKGKRSQLHYNIIRSNVEVKVYIEKFNSFISLQNLNAPNENQHSHK